MIASWVQRAGRVEWRRWLPYISLAFAAAALTWVAHVLSDYSLQEIWRSLASMTPHTIALAIAFTAAAYGALTLFDYLGLRYAQRRLPYHRVALASFAALSIGHTVGLAPFSSGAVRYRYYARWGIGKRQIGLLILFCAVTVGIGEMALSGLVLLLRPQEASRILDIGEPWPQIVGAACWLLLGLYVALCTWRRSLRLWRWRLPLPGWRLALAQLAVGLLNYSLVIAVLWVCLGATMPIDYATASIGFVLANLVTLVSAVPGGLGVIEAVILTLLPGAKAAGGVLGFRLFYFLLPFILGAGLFAATELLGRRGRTKAP